MGHADNFARAVESAWRGGGDLLNDSSQLIYGFHVFCECAILLLLQYYTLLHCHLINRTHLKDDYKREFPPIAQKYAVIPNVLPANICYILI